MNNKVIIQGSSRSKGNTNTIINHINQKNDFDIIDLTQKNIGHFDYDFNNAGDDFIPLMEEIIKKYDTIVFATPVYWYAMSGVLKVFFDRLSDLLHYKKELGRKLRGKKMAMISCGSGPELKKEFKMPFTESANYLGMEYLGDIHTWLETDLSITVQLKAELLAFTNKIN